ncbi:LuxR C-terminal-related transcriptional regulator [Mycolicibacterium pyrenivorans]|uniref:LuxR C-terminal-related transcriptional regulator n=1 Tax=Mycolicibacterium pyrenivorans TaxID=187102 RepID=UPI0021F2AB8E|nr:LuxR C-terminal-related transcriptional regulator [Mycolicibacterium pyrenivorans]MCV7149936.1 LuxR family transcriptional regulator [Mycolicibacterium pyrenivorans]
MVAGEWQPYIPAVTIGRPRIGAAVIRRPTVVQRLLGAADGDLVVVTAPAGYGKTAAAALWDEADARPFAWVRLDYLDDDPVHLLLHIATAVAELRGRDDGVLRYLRGPGRAALTHLVPAVVRLLEASGPLVLVLDDTHELSAPDAIGALHVLVDTVPSSTTVALLGRSRLPLGLARRRVQQKVVEVGVEELRFTGDEAAAALESVCGPLEEAAGAAVVDLCEGWAAGVILVGMALRDGVAVESITGRSNMVVEYLVEEVLERVDADTVTFLMESAVLDRFSAEQLDTLLERDDSGYMLEKLSDSGNLFLVPLDHHRVWYRYHHLFGDVLRSRLRATARDRFRALASRAADLLDRSGDVDGALLQALNAGDRARAAGLVGREAVRLGFDGRAGVLARRLALLDARTFAEHPDAAVARAWLGVTTGDAELIQRSLMLAHQADSGRPLADGTPSVKVAAALISSLVGVGGVRDVVRHADVVLAAGDNLVNPWWGAATVTKGAAESMLGNASRARALLESALPVIDDLPGFQAAALAHLSLLYLGAGDDDGAVERSDAARTLADKYDLCDVVPMVVVYAVSAVMAARVGDTAAALESVALTETLLDRLGNLAARTALLGHGLLAWTAAVIRDSELLGKHLEAAERARLREPDAVALSQRVDRVRAMVAEGCRPLTAAELRLLPHLATHLSLQRIAEELVIGRETVKSQATSIYRKLGVTSRAEAVGEARRVGLLSA